MVYSVYFLSIIDTVLCLIWIQELLEMLEEIIVHYFGDSEQKVGVDRGVVENFIHVIS